VLRDARAIQLLLAELRARIDADPAQDERSDDSQEQLLMLERLTVDERVELRRLIAKAQGTPNDAGDEGVHAVDPLDSHQVMGPQADHQAAASEVTRSKESDEGNLLTMRGPTNRNAE
jgi:hypothetical protein